MQLEAAESLLCSGAPLAALERCKSAEDAAQKVRALRKNHVGRIKELESKVNAVQPSIDCLQEQIGSLERQLQNLLARLLSDDSPFDSNKPSKFESVNVLESL